MSLGQYFTFSESEHQDNLFIYLFILLHFQLQNPQLEN